MATTITGTNGNDTITVNSNGTFVINAKNGNDTVSIVGNGNDVINLGNGNDSVNIVGNGNNDVNMGNGNDVVSIAGNGNNDIDGGNGNDKITIVGNGNNDVDLGNGNDTVSIVGNGNNDIDLGNGNDTISIVGNGNNSIDVGNGKDNISINGNGLNLIEAGNGGNNIALSGLGTNLVITGNGADVIRGSAGNDFIFAGGGNDIVYYSAGRDFLDGGVGLDALIFSGMRSEYVVAAVGCGLYKVTDLLNSTALTLFENFESFQFAGGVTMNLAQFLASNGAPNHPAVIGGVQIGSVTEDLLLTASGQLTVADPDPGQNSFQAVAAAAGIYGSFTMDATGLWSYNLNNAAANVQALAAGQQVHDTFTIKSFDGTQAVIDVTINGTNDAAVIGGVQTGVVQGDVILTANGALTVNDIDTGQNSFIAATLAGAYGSLSINAAGQWVYTLNNLDPVVQNLAFNQVVQDAFTVNSFDGTAAAVNITINGTDHAPIFSAIANQTVVVNQAFSLNLGQVVSDIDLINGDSLAFVVSGLAGATASLDINGNLILAGVAPNAAAADLITIKATDSLGLFAQGTFTLNVVTAPPLFTNNADNVIFNAAGQASNDGGLTYQDLSYFAPNSLYNTLAGNDVVNNLQYMPGLDTHIFQLGDGVDQARMSVSGAGTQIALNNQTIQGIDAGAGGDALSISAAVAPNPIVISAVGTSNAMFLSTAALNGGAGDDALNISATVSFQNFEDGAFPTGTAEALKSSSATLSGGDGNDALNVSASYLLGGVHIYHPIVNVFALDNSTATLDGGAGNDTLSVFVGGSSTNPLVHVPNILNAVALINNSVATLIGGAGDDTLNLGSEDSTSHFVLGYDMSMDNGNDTVNGFHVSTVAGDLSQDVLSFSNISYANLLADTTFTADVNGNLMLNLFSDAAHLHAIGSVDFANIVDPQIANPASQYVLSSATSDPTQVHLVLMQDQGAILDPVNPAGVTASTITLNILDTGNETVRIDFVNTSPLYGSINFDPSANVQVDPVTLVNYAILTFNGNPTEQSVVLDYSSITSLTGASPGVTFNLILTDLNDNVINAYALSAGAKSGSGAPPAQVIATPAANP